MMQRTLAPAALLALLYVNPPAALATVYTYTGPTFGPFEIQVTLNIPLADNLPPGTNVSADLTSFTSTVPPADLLGFPVGPPPSYQFVESPPALVEIGTDALGNITSWDIAGTLFASYPAFPGENPNDFFCTWAITTKNTGDTATFGTDNDAGLCPNTGTISSQTVGTWSPTFSSAVPEPASAILLGSGLLGLIGWRSRRTRVPTRKAGSANQ